LAARITAAASVTSTARPVADIGRRLVGEVAVEVPDLDRRAARCETLGDGLANSLSPAGDDGDMPVEVDLVHEALPAERFTVN
jgi:hypothetical protein